MNTATAHFADTLVQRVRQLGHPLCVGLDPYLDRIPAMFGGGNLRPAGPNTVRAVGSFLTAVLGMGPTSRGPNQRERIRSL
jgi:hypothetical protein